MQLTYNNKFKPQRNSLVNRMQKHAQKLAAALIVLVIGAWFLLSSSSSANSHKAFTQMSTKLHGYYKKDIPTKSALIFPSIEHAPLLREMSVNSLFNGRVDPQGHRQYVITDAPEDAEAQLNSKYESDDTTSQMVKVKKSFLDHGKQIFSGSAAQSPEVVIVTTVDFEKHELSHLTKVVQNRVNYAQKKKYGLYVRWSQEFMPMISETDCNMDWAKLYALRSAMYAFPNAKYFWWLDQDALIMRYDIDLIKYLLEPKVLNPIMLKDQPLIPPNGVIHTFKNTKPENVDVILTQAGQELNLDSFVLKNSFISKALVEFWNDNLFKTYHNFPHHTESALTHILQWHPRFLAHTAIVPPRTIASLHTALDADDDVHYKKGDFVVVLRDCAGRGTCEVEVESYWNAAEAGK